MPTSEPPKTAAAPKPRAVPSKPANVVPFTKATEQADAAAKTAVAAKSPAKTAKRTFSRPAAKAVPAAKAAPAVKRVVAAKPAAAPKPTVAAKPVVAAKPAVIAKPAVAAKPARAPKQPVLASGNTLKLRDLTGRVEALTGGKRKAVRQTVEAVLTVMGHALNAGDALKLPPLGLAQVSGKLRNEAGDTLMIRLERGPGKAAKPGKAARKAGKEALATMVEER